MRTIILALEFQVDDEGAEVLRDQAQQAIEEHGNGHEYDPGDLADCLAEVLLHSNPDIRPYLDYGVELVRSSGTVVR